MGVTVQIRNLDEAVTARLKARAGLEGLSLSEYLRRELTDLADQADAQERWEQLVVPGLHLSRAEIVASVHADRKWD